MFQFSEESTGSCSYSAPPLPAAQVAEVGSGPSQDTWAGMMPQAGRQSPGLALCSLSQARPHPTSICQPSGLWTRKGSLPVRPDQMD